MHEGVLTENKRVVVHRCYRRGCSSTDVGEDGSTGCIRADAAKVGVVERGLSVLVERRMLGRRAIAVELCRRRRIPCQPKAIDIEEAVASCDLMLCCDLIWVVGKELWEIAKTQRSAQSLEALCYMETTLLRNLFSEGMGLMKTQLATDSIQYLFLVAQRRLTDIRVRSKRPREGTPRSPRRRRTIHK